MSEINPGDVVTVTTDPPFSNEAGAPTDPTNVRLVWYVKGEPPTTWSLGSGVEQVETGVFKADILVARAGTHYYRWEGDGSVVAAAENSFEAVSKFGG